MVIGVHAQRIKHMALLQLLQGGLTEISAITNVKSVDRQNYERRPQKWESYDHKNQIMRNVYFFLHCP